MNKFILAPGPTQCDEHFLKVLSQPVKYHRCQDFHMLYKETKDLLKKIVSCKNGEALLLTCSGTGAMEASVSNFFNPGDKVLVVNIGNFGNRFVELCNTYKLNTNVLKYPIGSSYNIEDVQKYLMSNPDVKGVFATHHETSSGVLNQLEPIGKLISQQENCIFIVDSISGLMVHPMNMEKWHIDCLLAASQKGFLIPPGLAMAVLSNKAIDRLEASHLPCYYNDFRKYIKMQKINETPFTPNISLIEALNKSCKYIYYEYGPNKYIQYYHNLRIYLESKLRERGLDVDTVQQKNKGNVLVMLKVKPGWDAKVIHDALDEEGYIIATGFGEYKHSMLRIGVIGNVTKSDLDKFLICFDKTINKLYG